MAISLRDWATPLVAGAFLLSGVTGVLIFFHLDSGLNKEAHEWLGWALLIGAAAHVASNFPAFKKRFQQPLTKIIVGTFAALLLLSFAPVQEEGNGKAIAFESLNTLAAAPISTVAQLTQQDAAVILERLKETGLNITSADQSIHDATKGDREATVKAFGVIYQK